MKYHHLDFTSNIDSISVGLNLTLGEIKILYNTCVDVLDEHPEMISYGVIMVKLGMVIDQTIESFNETTESKWKRKTLESFVTTSMVKSN